MLRQILTGHVYHVLNRGVDKRKIFLNEEDYLRFINDLFEFNDEQSINNVKYYFQNQSQSKVIARPYFERKRRTRKFLIEILVSVICEFVE